MHLAAAKKKIAQKAPGAASLQNNPRIVALFGGQIPAFMATARTAPFLAGAAMSSALFAFSEIEQRWHFFFLPDAQDLETMQSHIKPLKSYSMQIY